MSSQATDMSPKTLTPTEVPLKAEAQDSRSSLSDYRIARSLIRSILLPTNVQAMDDKGDAFQVHDSYDSLLWLAHHLDHFSNVMHEARCILKEAEEKTNHAIKRADDAELSKLKAKEELKKQVKWLESELLKGAKDVKERLRKRLPDFDLGLLESDDEEEVGEGREGEIHIEDLFNLAREDRMAEVAAPTPTPSVIVLSDLAEVGKSWAPDGA
ncbi:hypothetical protein COCNU_07G001070 [Cocos nucifera]|uniref:Uncharacterized protein n=1 Tax=Cocos nucifera TaxID=13894 RepID=A0A8K0IDN1_COCNU|nr:hypothetical protein COCNU_07G001070 [Cocos nucifera]